MFQTLNKEITNIAMESQEDPFSKLPGGDDSNNNELLGRLDDPFNDSSGDLFDKLLIDNNNNSINNNGNDMFNQDSGLIASSMFEALDEKGNDSMNMNMNMDMEMNNMMSHQTKSNNNHNNSNFHFTTDQAGGHGQGNNPFGSNNMGNMGNMGIMGNMGGWGSAQQQNNNSQMNNMLNAAPLNVSLGGGGGGGGGNQGGNMNSMDVSMGSTNSRSSVSSSLRRGKGSNTQLNSFGSKAIAAKANVGSSRMRSNKSDGLLARALKAKYNSSNSINNYNVNAAGAEAAINAQLSNNALNNGNALFGANTSLTAVENEGGRGGAQNASWGANAGQRIGGTSALMNMLQGGGGNRNTAQQQVGGGQRLTSSVSTTALHARRNQRQYSTGSKSSMQDLLRLSKKQSKTQSMLRQSSAQSLAKQTSSQSLKGSNQKLDVSSLLPPSHAFGHRNAGNQNATMGGFLGANVGNKSTPPAPLDPNAGDQNSLLHQSCRLYPTTAAVVESALRIDPGAIRKAIPVSMEQGSKGKKPQNVYGYPVNVAMTHGATMEVMKMLVEAGPDVLCQKDGTDGSGSLGIALSNNCDMAVVNLLIQANQQCVQVADRRGNYPLHAAVNHGMPLDVVKRLYQLYPMALQKRNFHSSTPLDIAQRSTRCSEDVMNFLQSCAFSGLESNAHHMEYGSSNTRNSSSNLEDGLDDIMETNF